MGHNVRPGQRKQTSSSHRKSENADPNTDFTCELSKLEATPANISPCNFTIATKMNPTLKYGVAFLIRSHQTHGLQRKPAFSHALCVSPQQVRKNTIFPRGISQGYQGVSRGIKGYQLPDYMGLWGISPPARFLRAYGKPRFLGYQIG